MQIIIMNKLSNQLLFSIGGIKWDDGDIQVKESTRSRFSEGLFLYYFSSSHYERIDMKLIDGVPVVRAISPSNRGEQINYRNAISSSNSGINVNGIHIGMYLVAGGLPLTIGVSAGALLFRSYGSRLREFN